MHSQDAAHYHYVHRKTVDSSIHGRVSTIPARLTGYGEVWDGDECTLWCEGVVQQSTVFGEDLHLIRRIEAKVGGNEILLKDRVVNHGFYRTPHMLCYHINVGHPVLAEGSRYLAPIEHVVWASHAESYRAQGVGYRTMPAPQAPFHEQVWEHWLAADRDGRVPVALVNDGFDGGRGLGFLVETRKSEFPCQFQWQNYQAGQYAMGIEPSTNHVFGKPFARGARRGDLARAWRRALLHHAAGRLGRAATRSPRWSSASAPSPSSRTPTIPSRPGAGTPWPEPWSSRARRSCSRVPPAASAPRVR